MLFGPLRRNAASAQGKSLAAQGLVGQSLALQAFTVGAVGCAIVAMITRTARGHTGRPLKAGRTELVCYGLLVLAAILRVLVPVLWPQAMLVAVEVTGACWIAAVAVYCGRYACRLWRPSIDGKDR